MTRRVLITGSRTWTDRALIHQHLAMISHHDLVIVHGHCPSGADRIADEIARFLSLPVERHPADWETYGRRAGYMRNAAMVAAGADLCLAYILDNSRGASMCADLAEAAGIATRRFCRFSPTAAGPRPAPAALTPSDRRPGFGYAPPG